MFVVMPLPLQSELAKPLLKLILETVPLTRRCPFLFPNSVFARESIFESSFWWLQLLGYSASKNQDDNSPWFCVALSVFSISTPGRIRTSNPRFRRPMLYPIEPRVRLN